MIVNNDFSKVSKKIRYRQMKYQVVQIISLNQGLNVFGGIN